jgi:phosphatidylglycerol:prolipoprotein diacylglycerol transferase
VLVYPDIDPVALSIGPVTIYWYGLMYLSGIALGWWLLHRRTTTGGFTTNQVADIVFWAAVGVIAGGRIGYLLFYVPADFLSDPLMLFRLGQGGMSFHGGLLGVLAAMWWYGRRLGRGFFEMTDFIAPVVPIGLGLGRLGNFINGELWGKPTDAPWGMVVNGIARHPSQLYQFALEGVVMFTVLYLFSMRARPVRAVSGLFALLYGVFRFAVEFIRLPDAHIGYIAFGWLTMGQILSLPLVLIGLYLLVSAKHRNGHVGAPPMRREPGAPAS